jgi:hypothetical protein
MQALCDRCAAAAADGHLELRERGQGTGTVYAGSYFIRSCIKLAPPNRKEARQVNGCGESRGTVSSATSLQAPA